MKADDILRIIDGYVQKVTVEISGRKELAQPETLASSIVLIRKALLALVEMVAEAELDYRHSKAVKYDELIKQGVKKSPAFDALDVDHELIEKKIASERLKNYLKYIDSLVSSIQTSIKVQTGIAKSEL